MTSVEPDLDREAVTAARLVEVRPVVDKPRSHHTPPPPPPPTHPDMHTSTGRLMQQEILIKADESSRISVTLTDDNEETRASLCDDQTKRARLP